MARILTNDTNTTPQAGGSICALKVIKIEIAATELVVGNVFDLGAPPEGGFKYFGTTLVSNLDGSVGLRCHIGTDDDEDYYTFSTFSTSATTGIQGGVGTGSEFPAGNIRMKVTAAPTIAQSGLMTVTLYGWS
ncbi:MAG: hypothetical protein ABJN69_12990 [Hellea sp.]